MAALPYMGSPFPFWPSPPFCISSPLLQQDPSPNNPWCLFTCDASAFPQLFFWGLCELADHPLSYLTSSPAPFFALRPRGFRLPGSFSHALPFGHPHHISPLLKETYWIGQVSFSLSILLPKNSLCTQRAKSWVSRFFGESGFFPYVWRMSPRHGASSGAMFCRHWFSGRLEGGRSAVNPNACLSYAHRHDITTLTLEANFKESRVDWEDRTRKNQKAYAREREKVVP